MSRLFAAAFLVLLTCAAVSADNPRLVEAHGGQARLQALTGLHYTLKQIDYQSGEVSLSEQWLDFTGQRLYRRDESKTGVRVRASDGKRGWIQDGKGVRTLSADEAKALLGSLHYNFLYLLPRARVEALADGAHYQVSAPFIEPFSVGVDGAGHISELTFPDNVTGKESDYREVQGIAWPFRYETYRNGLKQRSGEFLSFELNPDLSRVDFEPPVSAGD